MSALEAIAVDRRAEPRTPALLTAKIVYGAREEFSVDCVIRNTSAGGGRLRASLPNLPDQFKLLVYRSGEVHQAEIVWRGRGEIGVRLHDAEQLADAVGKQHQHVRRMWVDAVLQGV